MSRTTQDYEALLRRALGELRALKPEVEAARLTRSEPIAIVGVGCRFPGGANDPESFWRSLRDGVDGISAVPAERWDADAYFDEDRLAPGKMVTRRAGFVDDLFGFDERFFDIIPREAATMDPQQRLLLEVTYEALEHANIRVDSLYQSRTGVFVGISTFDSAVLQLAGDPERIDPYVGTGNALSAASGRLSYVLGLMGPSMAIDTACSSSLVATHLACSALRARECDLALVGGVNALMSPAPSINFSQAGMLSPDGRCKTFDARADGYVRGEGCGVLVLKRLSDARANGDAILAVIRGSAVNQDGPSGGLTVPNGPAQEAVIRQALSMTDIAPEQVAYVEAHGTGTSLGDPIEVNALAAALCSQRTKHEPLLVGSVKTNIGHCEAAAGVAGIIKVALSLAHREIPPHLNFEQPNPHIDWNALPVEVVTGRRAWPAGKPAIAGVSSFGFSGTNAHVILEAAPASEAINEAAADSHPYVLPLSAKTPAALTALAGRFDAHLAAHPDVPVSEICRTAALGRRHFEHRLVIGASSVDELRSALRSIADQGDAVAGLVHASSGIDRSVIELAERYAGGDDVDWTALYRDGRGPAVRIPTYPFQRRQFPIARPHASSAPEKTMTNETRNTSASSAAPPRVATLVDKLREMSHSLTGIDVAEIDPQRNVFELGFDSITLMRLRQAINKVFGLSIAMSDLSQLESLALIAGYLDENLPADPVAAPQPAAQPASAAPVAAPQIAMPALASGAVASNSELGGIFAKQLELMAKQIELLSRSGAAMAVAPTPAVPVASAAPATRPVPAKTTTPVALPSFKKLNATPKARVTDQQQQEIQTLIDDYGSKTRRSKEMTQEYRSVFANIRNVAGFRPEWKELIYQIIVDRAAGTRFTDIDGRDYLDITMGFGVYLFGHRPDFIESAVSQSLERGAPIGPMCQDAGEVARRIHQLTGVDRVAFFNTGSEAVMSAIRLARTVTKRPKIVMFAGSYHGHTDNLLATGHGTETLPMIPGTPESMVSETCVLPYGEDESLEFIEQHGHELAAVLVEPVQSRKPEYQPTEFLKKLRAVTEKTGTALIFDEVILGFRIQAGGAQAHFGVKADMVTYGKTIGGGMPIGIVAGKSKFLDAIDGGMWRYGDDSTPPSENTFIAGTFNHHPLAMAAALAVLKRIESAGPALYDNLNRRTAELAARLNRVFEREGVPISVVHFGSLFRFKMTGQWELFCYYMLTRGVYIWEGRNCFLSTAHTDADLDFLIRATEESIADMRAASAAPAQTFAPSTAQHRLYALSQTTGGELAYHVPIAMIVDGPLDEARLRNTVRELARRHEALRTSFKLEGDGLVQVVHPDATLALEHVSVDGGGNDAIDAAIARFIRPFDLEQAPLVRMGLGSLPGGRHLLILDAQHIIFDGMSVTVFVEDFLRIYSGEVLPPPASSYRSYVEREQVYLQSADCARDEKYWLGQLGGDRHLRSLPLDRPRPARQSFAGATLYRRIDPDLTRELKNLARRNGTTLNIVLLAAHFTLLHKLTGADDIIVGCPTDGRLDDDLRGVIGMFIHTVALRARPSASTTIAQLFDELKQRTLEGQDHVRYPLEVLVEKLGIKRDMTRNPLFDTVFVYQNLESSTITAGDLTLTGHDVRKSSSVVDLAWDISEVDRTLNMLLDFNSDVFDEVTVEGFIDRYVAILRTFAQAPADLTLHAIESVTPAEQQRLRAFNDTKREVAQTTVPQLFEAQTARDASAVALVCDGTTLTYGELNERANRLAHHLIASVGRGRGLNEQLVGIALPRSIDMVVAVLATLKAGGAYLPLDPAYPEARCAAMIADAKPAVVLTQDYLADASDALAEAAIDNPSDAIRMLRPDTPAYVIYTSGSTGTPKGVVLEHHAVTNYVTWAADTYTQGRPLAFPLFTTLAFDLTVTSLFVPLATGGRIVIYADDPAVPAVLRVFGENAVDVVKLTPSHLSMVAHLDLRGSSIRTLIVGGEDLKTELCRRIDEKFDGQVAIFNEYGPTEAAVGCMIHRFDPERDRQTSVPIGVPVANARIYVLDGLQSLAPIGAVGELYVAGDGLARGYLGRPELTAERFVADPFEAGARMYRTGDLARRRADGSVEYLGRTDHQVKIRGFRVELGEIEAALVSLDTIADAAVIAHPDATGTLQLVAYIVTRSGVQGVDTAPLRRQLELRLPGYMVPAVFIVLDRLPLSSNGKLDRGALPSPDQGIAGTGVTYEAPRDDVEKALADVWQGVLGREQVSIHDNFFDLGGDSIKALQVVMRLQQRGYTLAPADLIDRAEFADVAAQIRATTSRVSQEPVTGAVPLTPVQSWFAGGSSIDQHHFNQAVLLRSGSRLKEAAVRAVLEKIQDHHDALRMRFRRRDGELLQETADVGGAVTLDVVDLRDQPQHAERSMQEHLDRLQASFDLERGPLMKAAIYRLPDADRLLLVAHHLIVDGVSWRVLLEDLASGYDRALAGRAIVFPAKTDSYQTWAQHLQQLAQSGAFAAERPYWESMAAGTSPQIPGNHDADDLQADSECLRVVLTTENAETLAAVRGAGATVQTVLLTALARALRQVTGWKQSRVTMEHHGRGAPKSDLDVSRTVGWFTALYPLTVALPDGDDLQADLDYTRDALQRVPNHGLGYGVLRYLTPERPLTPAAEPRIVFNYLGEFSETAHAGFSLDRIDERRSISPRRPRTHELELEAVLLGGGLEISLTFGGRRHDRQTMTALLSAIEAETRALLAHARSGAHIAPAGEFTSAIEPKQLQEVAAAAGVSVQDVADVYPLSALQEGMLLHALIDDDTSTFFIQFCFTIDGALDVELFRQTWSRVLQRHDALRARFVHQGVDRPVQVVLRERELPFHFEDLRSVPPEEQAERLARFRQADRARGFDLTHDVLMRLAVFQDSERRFVAVLSVHHIVIDGWCLAPLFTEMATTYRALSRGAQPALPDATRYASFIRWLDSHDREATRTFWETYLRGFARPTGLPRAGDDGNGATPGRRLVVGELSAKEAAALTRAAAERRVTLSSTLRAAWSLLLGKYNASDDVVFGVVVSGRPPDLPGVERMIGMFINTVPLRIRLEPDLGLAAFARKLQDDWREIEAHQYASLADVQSLSALGGDLIDHSLVVQNYPIADGLREIEQELDGLFTIPDVDIVEQANYPLMIEATPGERLRVEFSYDPQVHDDQLIDTVKAQLLDILRTIAAAPDTTVGEMRERLMTSGEQAEREAFAQSIRTVSQEF